MHAARIGLKTNLFQPGFNQDSTHSPSYEWSAHAYSLILLLATSLLAGETNTHLCQTSLTCTR